MSVSDGEVGDWGDAVPDYWTYDLVEGRMVEAMRFAWRDEPGSWPFASDGPWHLMSRERSLGDYDARGGDMEQATLRPLPLARAERGRMEQAVEWLRIVQADEAAPRRGGKAPVLLKGGNARLVVLVTRKLAAKRASSDDRGQIRWAQLLRPLGLAKGAGMLSKRYSKSIAAIAAELNRLKVPVTIAMD